MILGFVVRGSQMNALFFLLLHHRDFVSSGARAAVRSCRTEIALWCPGVAFGGEVVVASLDAGIDVWVDSTLFEIETKRWKGCDCWVKMADARDQVGHFVSVVVVVVDVVVAVVVVAYMLPPLKRVCLVGILHYHYASMDLVVVLEDVMAVVASKRVH